MPLRKQEFATNNHAQLIVFCPIGVHGLNVMCHVEEDLQPEPELFPLLLNLEDKLVVKPHKRKVATFNHAQ